MKDWELVKNDVLEELLVSNEMARNTAFVSRACETGVAAPGHEQRECDAGSLD